MQLIAGISCELIRMSGKKRKSMFFNIISAPGLRVNKITTREPDISQVEVALASLDALSGNIT